MNQPSCVTKQRQDYRADEEHAQASARQMPRGDALLNALTQACAAQTATPPEHQGRQRAHARGEDKCASLML